MPDRGFFWGTYFICNTICLKHFQSTFQQKIWEGADVI